MAIPAIDELTHILEYQDDRAIELLLEIVQAAIGAGEPCGIFDLESLSEAIDQVKRNESLVTCDVCHRTVPSLDHASNEGWLSETWYARNDPGPAPVCPECGEKFFHYVEGEEVIRPPGEWLC